MSPRFHARHRTEQVAGSRRDVKPVDDKKQQKKAALEDMEVRKTQDQSKKARLKAVEDDSDDEKRSPRGHEREKQREEPHFEKTVKPRCHCVLVAHSTRLT